MCQMGTWGWEGGRSYIVAKGRGISFGGERTRINGATKRFIVVT